MALPINRGGREAHSEDFKIDQKADIDGDLKTRKPDIVEVDHALDQDLFDELAFMEEPVLIRLEPSSDPNAATMIPIWVNGKGCEVLINGRWVEFTYLPVGEVVTVKRKYLNVLIAAKQEKVTTHFGKPGEENPKNTVKRFTSAYQTFQVIEDKSPRGMAWLTEMRRRNL